MPRMTPEEFHNARRMLNANRVPPMVAWDEALGLMPATPNEAVGNRWMAYTADGMNPGRTEPNYLAHGQAYTNTATGGEPEETNTGYADYAQTVTGRYIPNQRMRPEPVAAYQDTDDDFRDIKIKEKAKVKAVALDEETINAIVAIVDSLIVERGVKLESLLQKRVDYLKNICYTDFLNSYTEESVEGTLIYEMQQIHSEFNRMVSGEVISSDAWFYKVLEEKAKRRYHVEYSKYKYYPRLKAAVKYGNPALLAKILTVTQMIKGKVLCPAPF